MYKKICFVLIILLLSFGCASTQPKVYINHAPANSHLLILENPKTGIVLYSQVVKDFVRKEGNEKDIWSEPVPVSNKVKIGSNVKRIKHRIRVANLKKVDYSIFHVFTYVLDNDRMSYEIKLYEGSFSRKDFDVPVDIKGIKSCKSHVEVRDPDGDLLLVSRRISYERREKNSRE